MAKDLHDYLRQLEEQLQDDFMRVKRAVAPAQFDVTALLQHFENRKKFPVLFFENPLNLKGKAQRRDWESDPPLVFSGFALCA